MHTALPSPGVQPRPVRPDCVLRSRANVGNMAAFVAPMTASGASGSSRPSLACQANPRRVARVSKQIEREIGLMFLKDKLLLDVTQSKNSDGGLRALCSCSGVEVSNDLQVVKVFVSVFTTEEDVRTRIITRLHGLSGYVRRLIGERVRLRLTPEIRFVHDVAVDRGERVLSILQQLETDGIAAPSSSASTSGTSAKNGANSDEEEGFFDLTGNGATSDSEEKAEKPNPFLEGVGDDKYDDIPDSAPFFTADMFPDAKPELDQLTALKKTDQWNEKSGAKKKFRRKK